MTIKIGKWKNAKGISYVFKASDDAKTLYVTRKDIDDEFTCSFTVGDKLITKGGKLVEMTALDLNRKATENGYYFKTKVLKGNGSSSKLSAANQTNKKYKENNRIEFRNTKTKQRLGQNEFRKNVLKQYQGKCLVSGCDVEGALQAAHIVPVKGKGSHDPENGLLLRADIHLLFDLQLLGIDPEGKLYWSPELKNSDYYQFKQCRFPAPISNRLKANLIVSFESYQKACS